MEVIFFHTTATVIAMVVHIFSKMSAYWTDVFQCFVIRFHKNLREFIFLFVLNFIFTKSSKNVC